VPWARWYFAASVGWRPSGRCVSRSRPFQELARLGLGLDEEDACDVLAKLSLSDLVGRQVSERTGEWMYVFRPVVGVMVVYVKLVIRADCVVISFHEQEGSDDDE